MGRPMLEAIRKIGLMAKASIIGEMETIIKESFRMGLDMVRATLIRQKLASSIKVSTKTIKNVDMGR